MSYCRCGCGQLTRVNTKNARDKGWIKGESRKIIQGHAIPPIERILAKTVVDPKKKCWIFTGAVIRRYGTIQIGRGKSSYVHRVSWEFFNQKKVPNGLQILHSCDMPLCVNPSHLSVGTSKQNIAEAYERNRRSNHCVRCGTYRLDVNPDCETCRKRRNSQIRRGVLVAS